MDFDFTPEQETFRQEVRAWLAENVPADLKGRGFASSRADVKEVERLRDWQRTLHKAGYVGMDWPAEYGGRRAPIMETIILLEEELRAGRPPAPNPGRPQQPCAPPPQEAAPPPPGGEPHRPLT